MKIEQIAKTKQEVVFEAEQQKEVKEGRFLLHCGKLTKSCDLIKTEMIVDAFTGAGIIQGKEIKYKVTDIEAVTKAKSGLWVHCQKLIVRMQHEITKRDQTQISIPIKDFAQKCDVDLQNSSAVKEFQRNMMQALRVLFKLEIGSFQDWQDGKERLVSVAHAIRRISQRTRGFLSFEIEEEFKNYVKKLPIKSFPESFYKISGKNPNALCIAMKLADYNGGNNNKISIQNLLKETTLPLLLDVKENKNLRWTIKIRNPFNKALDELTNIKLLKTYYFVTQNGDKRTREEANAMTAEQWHSLYFVYELA